MSTCQCVLEVPDGDHGHQRCECLQVRWFLPSACFLSRGEGSTGLCRYRGSLMNLTTPSPPQSSPVQLAKCGDVLPTAKKRSACAEPNGAEKPLLTLPPVRPSSEECSGTSLVTVRTKDVFFRQELCAFWRRHAKR